MPVGGSSRALFRLLIPGLVTQGLGANAILGAARDMGFGVQRQWGLGQIREISGLMRLERAVRGHPRDVLPHRGLMVETELRRPRRYRVFADVTYFNTETGERQSQLISFYDDERLTKEQWRSAFDVARGESAYRTDEVVEKFDIRSIEHNKGWSY